MHTLSISSEQNNVVDDDLQITITNVPPPNHQVESISLWRRFLQGKPPSDVDPRDWSPMKKYTIVLIVALSAFTYDPLSPHTSYLYFVIDLRLLLVLPVLQPFMCVVYRAITDQQACRLTCPYT